MIRSYARSSSRGLKDFHHQLYIKYSSLFLTRSDNLEQNLEKFLISNKENQIWLEIGFGYGDFITQALSLYKDTSIIGCDPYITGGYKLLGKLDKACKESLTEGQEIKPEKKLRLFLDDVYHLLEVMPNEVLDRVIILFPDPWQKSKQKKRRLVDEGFLLKIHTKLKTKSDLVFASDHLDYIEAVSLAGQKSNLFQLIEEDKSLVAISTKYKSKAKNKQRSIGYLFLEKIEKSY